MIQNGVTSLGVQPRSTQSDAADARIQPLTQPALVDPEVQLLVPENDAENPEVSIVIPAMNEAITISDFIAWCKEGLEKAGVVGEILIVDSSTDETPGLALVGGARVLKTPKRGLGRAYIDAIPYIRGKYILMGDADCTYDFREIAGFVEKFRAGYEFIMGSRYQGYIETHAMPPLHRYFGTPVTTWILNLVYSTKFSDIHCGMRGLTRDALIRLDLSSQSWEYASEMVLKAVCLGLTITEVPVRFLKDREGRLSHMKRSGWLEPWRAGWINLKAMFLFAPDFFLFWPSLVLLALGLLLVLGLVHRPIQIGPIVLSLHWMLLGVTFTTLGYTALHLALLAKAYYDFRPTVTEHVTKIITYNRGMFMGGLMMLVGISMDLGLTVNYISSGLTFDPSYPYPYFGYGVLGLLFIILGFQTITHTLIFHMVLYGRRRTTGRS
jgi:glycosyltransferase involved in cell wall biosynthesis